MKVPVILAHLLRYFDALSCNIDNMDDIIDHMDEFLCFRPKICSMAGMAVFQYASDASK